MTELADGRIASGSMDQDIHLWNPVDDSTIAFESHSGMIDGIVEVGPGQLVTGSHGWTLYVWDVADESVLEVEFEWGCLSLGVIRLPPDVRIEDASEIVYFRNALGDVMIGNPVCWDFWQIGEAPLGIVDVKHIGTWIVAAGLQSIHVFNLVDSDPEWIEIKMPAPVTALTTDEPRRRVVCGTIRGVVAIEMTQA